MYVAGLPNGQGQQPAFQVRIGPFQPDLFSLSQAGESGQSGLGSILGSQLLNQFCLFFWTQEPSQSHGLSQHLYLGRGDDGLDRLMDAMLIPLRKETLVLLFRLYLLVKLSGFRLCGERSKLPLFSFMVQTIFTMVFPWVFVCIINPRPCLPLRAMG